MKDNARQTTVRAAGAVLWREHPYTGAVEVALVHRPRYDDWSLPKGKLDAGETPAAAAVREIEEETGFRAVLGRILGQVRYPVTTADGNHATKTVDYFSARAVAGDFHPNRETCLQGRANEPEVDQLRWVLADRAHEELSYPHDREVLAKFTALPADTKTLLLVRHAKAGDRTEWDGPDDERPLSHSGRKQAEALRKLLPLFGVSRIHAAPRVRCVETVQPLAEELGAAVIEEPLLTEEVYWDQRDAGGARLLEIAAKPGIAVVCSQGGSIPDLVSRLAAAGGLALRDVPSKKGSTWVLSFASDEQEMADQFDQKPAKHVGLRLVAADYIPDPLL